MTAGSIGGTDLYTYCENDPINYYDDSGCFPRKTISRNDPYIGIDDMNTSNEHVHVNYNGKSYSWYKISHKTRENNKYYGLNDISKTAQKELKEAGLPQEYFNKSTYISLPNWKETFEYVSLPSYQEGFSTVTLPRWQEGISWWNGLSASNQIVIIVSGVIIIGVVIYVLGPTTVLVFA